MSGLRGLCFIIKFSVFKDEVSWQQVKAYHMVLQPRNRHPSLCRCNCLVIEPYRRCFGPNKDRLTCRCHFCYSSESSLLCCRERRRWRLSFRRPYNTFGYPLLTLCWIIMGRGVLGEKRREPTTISLLFNYPFLDRKK